MPNLMRASREWANRPADERYWNLADMKRAARLHADNSQDRTLILSDCTVQAKGDDLVLVGRNGIPARFTNYSFGQLAAIAKAPPSYLSQLPANLAADCMNVSLAANAGTNERKVLLDKSDPNDLQARCYVSTRYARVWNHELISQLQTLGSDWRNPPAYATAGDPRAREATEEDCIPGVSIITPGTLISPAGLYCSDRDFFAFLVHTSRILDGSPKGLSMGIFMWNSEVGAASVGISCFAFDYVCGNHCVWDASNVTETRFRHIGSARERAITLIDMARLADKSASEFEAKVSWARRTTIATNVEDCVAEVIKRIAVTAKVAKKAWDIGIQNESNYGNVGTVWNVVSSLTQIARDMPHTDSRVALETEASKLLTQ